MDFGEFMMGFFEQQYLTDPVDLLLRSYIQQMDWSRARSLIKDHYFQASVWAKGYDVIDKVFKEENVVVSLVLVKMYILIQPYVEEHKKFPLLKFLLYFAVVLGSVPLMNILLNLGVKVNRFTPLTLNEHMDIFTPLSLAIYTRARLEIISLLISYGARVNDNRLPPLLSVIMYPPSDFEVAEFLVHSGADINIRLTDPSIKPVKTLVHMACSVGNHEGLQWLFDHKASREVLSDSDANNALFSAVSAYSLPCIKILVDHKVSIDMRNNHRKTPLVIGIENNQKDIAEFFICKGAKWSDSELNKAFRSNVISESLRDTGNHPHQMMEMLVTYGFHFDVNMIDKAFLLAAVQIGYLWIVKKYVKAGKKLYSFIDGYSLLVEAVNSTNLGLVEIICNSDINFDKSSIEYALTTSVTMNLVEITQVIILSFSTLTNQLWFDSHIGFAADYLNIDMLEFLLRFGAEVNSKDMYGVMPLHYAILSDQVFGDPQEIDLVKSKVVKFLLNQGADANTEIEIIQGKNKLPIHEAIYRNYAEVLKVLCENGASLDKDVYLEKNNLGSSTILHFAIACKSNKTIINTLVQYGAAVDAVQYDGKTPLQMAIEHNNFEMVQVLLENGANVCKKSTSRQNLVEYAVGLPVSSLIVSKLLEFGANVDETNSHGLTALQKACHMNKGHMVRVLLNHGADINLLVSDIFVPFKDQCSAKTKMEFFAMFYINYMTPYESQIPIFLIQRQAFMIEFLGLPLSPIFKPFLEVEYSKDFYDICDREVEVLKNTKIGSFLCLYDIIRQNRDPAYRYNKSLCDLACGDPVFSASLFSGILKCCLRKAELRNKLLDTVQEWISHQLRISCLPVLPNEVIRRIISYLDNETLRCISSTRNCLP